jgi:hypothetical protein
MQKTKGDGMAGSTRISDILDHLAWLRMDIHKVRGETDGHRVLKNVLFVYNAATLFEWYVTVSRPDTSEFPYHTRDQAPAKRRANRFVMLIAKSVDQIQKAQLAPGTKKANSIPTYVAAVEEALDGFLNSLPTAFSAGIRPIRIPELEMPVNPRELLAQQVSEIPVPGVGAGPADGGDHKATDPLSPLMQVLGIIFALEELKTTGELLPEAHAGLRDVTAGYLADALGEAAKATTPSIAKRLQRLEKQVADSITPATPERN